MGNTELPFLAQAAVLDTFVHSPCPSEDPHALRVVLDVLRTRPDLRAYFLRANPHPAWARILWDHGFFDSPPPPIKTERGLEYPVWDVQTYLVAVASQVPDIVVKHVKAVDGHGWYIARAVHALCNVPGQLAEEVLPRVLQWLDDPTVVPMIVHDCYELMLALAKNRCTDAAFRLLSVLTSPVLRARYEYLPFSMERHEPVAILCDAPLRRSGEPDPGLRQLEELDVCRTVRVLEDALRAALDMEAKLLGLSDYARSSGWRSAIEDSDQDHSSSTKEDLLRALRHAMQAWIGRSPQEAEVTVQRYLADEYHIFRRLGLYLICTFPDLYPQLVQSELGERENLDDAEIRREIFLLLQRGYPHLPPSAQQALLEAILRGPSGEKVQRFASRAAERYGEDAAQHVERFSARWVRDRLWMLRQHLDDALRQRLEDLVQHYGHPDDLALTNSPRAYFIRDVSPVDDEELAALTPQQLLEFIGSWQPSEDVQLPPEHVSRVGLARAVAALVVPDPGAYANCLVDIASCGPEFGGAIVNSLRECPTIGPADWGLWLDLFERLLANDAIRHDVTYGYEVGWPSVRVSIARAIDAGLKPGDRAIPRNLLQPAKRLLLLLLDDADPLPKHDRPAEGWLGHDDPLTVALNTVRPLALTGLVRYALRWAHNEEDGLSPHVQDRSGRLEPDVRDALSRKLDKTHDPSRALHSVFGRFLRHLYWLDPDWVTSNIDRIFPELDDEESTWFFIAGWDAFVAFNPYCSYLIDILRCKYERAIQNMARGLLIKSTVKPVSGLAIHLVCEYLLSSSDLCVAEGRQTLVARFFKIAPQEARARGAWACCQICRHEDFDLRKHWPKIRALIEWRVREASLANHSSDFDGEMEFFAQLLPIAAKVETIRSLWPILEGLVPHVTRSPHHRTGWEALARYLSVEVETDPVRSMQLYRLMCDQRTGADQWNYHDKSEHRILEVAAAHAASRAEALALIDDLVRRQDYTFRPIYDLYA